MNNSGMKSNPLFEVSKDGKTITILKSGTYRVEGFGLGSIETMTEAIMNEQGGFIIEANHTADEPKLVLGD